MEDNPSSSSSAVSAVPETSFLQEVFQRLSSTQSLKLSPEEAAPVAVVGLQRYLSEQVDPQQQHQHAYSYDVTVTDGVWRAKCLLHHSLAHLVLTNSLRTGADIRITQCSFVYNERRLGHGFVCIQQLSCGAAGSALLPRIKDASSLPMLLRQGMERSVLLHRDVPLQLGRKHYLALWNSDDPEGDAWSRKAPTSDTVLDVSKIALLSSLESSFRSQWTHHPLLVKILHKSRLRYYGRLGLNIDYPYQAYFEVADHTGIMSLVLWNDLCPEFYHRMSVGAVLYLQNYTVKPSYSNRSHPQMDHHGLTAFNSVEICLNPRNPSAVVTVLSPKSVQPQWGLPDVSYQFITRSELETLSNDSACDVIGLVLFVGRVERVKSKGNKGPEKYWTYRWIHAVDGTSGHPFILEVFSSSEPEIFSRISPMTYLVCTQMRVCQAEGSPPYLTSSCETETFITGYHKGQPYVSEPRVKSFIQWTKTLKDNDILQKTAVGGHYCYPRPPPKYTQPLTDASGQAPLVSVADLKRELETLQYREHKKLAVQGQIAAVRYVTSLPSDEKQAADVAATPALQDALSRPPTAQHASPARPAPPPAVETPERTRKRRIQTRAATKAAKLAAERMAGSAAVEEEEEVKEIQAESMDIHEQGPRLQPQTKGAAAAASAARPASPPSPADPEPLSWESSGWPEQRRRVSEHLCRGGLWRESVSRRFSLDEKDALLRRSGLQPGRWSPEHTRDAPPPPPPPPAPCPGYYQVTILGINKQIAVDAAYLPVVSSGDPRAAGMAQDPHGNSMLSCLSSGFLCPLTDPDSRSQATLPEPGEILATAGELQDTHVVCILDICHLGGDQVEVLITKVYKAAEASLD